MERDLGSPVEIALKPLSLKNNKVLVWGHRGARSLAAENTLRAMRLAYESGADGWEFDVQLTRDGKLIVLHDLNLLRTTNAGIHPLFVANGLPLPWRFSLAEIKQLSADVFPRRLCPPHYAEKPWLDLPDVLPDDIRVPTLEEVLDMARSLSMWLNIEIKDIFRAVPAELAESVVERVHQLVVSKGMKNQVILSSFNHDYMAESKKLDPDILTGLLTAHRFKEDPLELLRRFKADAWHPGFLCLDKNIVRNVRAGGFAVNPYTVNDAGCMRKLAEWGVTGLVTDNPQNVPSAI